MGTKGRNGGRTTQRQEPEQNEDEFSVNTALLVQSLNRQIGQQAATHSMEVAMKDAMIETLKTQLAQLRAEVDELAAAVNSQTTDETKGDPQKDRKLAAVNAGE